MYEVNEYYQAGKGFAKPTKHLRSLVSLEEAKDFADTASREMRPVPESENVWIGVLDASTGRIVYGPVGPPSRQ